MNRSIRILAAAPAAAQSQARVRVVHASPDAPAVDVVVAGLARRRFAGQRV